MVTQISPRLKKIYQIFKGINFQECADCTKCCYLPSFLEEEFNYHQSLLGGALRKVEDVPYVLNFSLCTYCQDGKCAVYPERPLDCRLYPLDIIEEESDYWWIVYIECPEYKKISKKLMPFIELLEKLITPEIFEEYKKQISVSKKIYRPYKLKNYKKIKKYKLSE